MRFSYYNWRKKSAYVNSIKRFIPFRNNRHQSETVKTELGRFHKAVDVWAKVVIGIAGLLLAYLLHIQQRQLTKEIETVRKDVSESQLDVQKKQFAASLINPLLSESEKAKLLSLAALERVDKELWQIFSEIVARTDSDDSVRLTTIDNLGEKGDGTVRQTLRSIQKEGKTEADRQQAKQAEANLTSKFKENLKTAKAFFGTGQLEIAAKYFYEAARYVDQSQVENDKLAAARSHYEHGGYREAAIAFNSLFSKL